MIQAPAPPSLRLPLHDELGIEKWPWVTDLVYWRLCDTRRIQGPGALNHVEGIVANMDDYLRVRPQLFPCHEGAVVTMTAWAER